MSEKFEREVIDRLAKIETRLDAITFDPSMCAKNIEKLSVANHRINAIERQQGKQNLVAAVLGTVGASVALIGKYVATKIGS